MNLKILLLTLFISAFGFAQKGTVTGTVTDKDMNNETLPFASVVVKGTPIGTNTDENGAYTLSVPAGTHTLIFGFLGYESVEVQVTVQAGETKTINQALASTSVQLEDVVIEKTFNREKETALLLDQKNAVEIKQSIGAQEMSRKGVSDAQSAVTKVAGISRRQGEKNVFVRGLGDRYNSTTLNGMPLPSEDPTSKNISLDFFGSDVIKNIGVNKTFSSSIPGDVGGANIDIVSKEFTGDDYVEISIGSGINTQTFNEDFYTIDGENFMGFSNKESNVNDLNVYSFENSLDPNMQSMQLNSSLSVSGGKRFDIGDNTLNMFLTGSMENGYVYKEGTVRQNTSAGSIVQDMDFQRYTYNTSQTLMGNFKYKFNNNTISLNSLYIHDNNQDLGNYFGFNGADGQENDLEYLRRQQTNNNNLIVNQLLSEIELNDNMNLDLGVSYNMIRTSEPDRRVNNFLFRDGTYRPDSNSAGNHERYFGEMNEDDIAGKGILSYSLNAEKSSKLDVGFNVRHTKREFEALIFNHRFNNSALEVDINNLSALFNQQNLDNGVFELQTGRASTQENPEAFTPFWYEGTRSIYAGLASFTHSFNDKLTLVAGARFDKINQEVDYNTNIATNATFGDAIVDESYILPNFNLKYSINENSILRMAGSMSYTLPQFIEVAPFKYPDVNFSTQGNPDLVPSQNYNFDLKWEYYPESDEIIALTGYYKQIIDPINRTEIPIGGNVLTYFNTGGTATVAGAELELRKNIYKVSSTESTKESVLSGGVNISYLYSVQKLEATLPSFTKFEQEDELQGASPVLANADLTFRKTGETYNVTSSVVFNYFSDRIFSLGTRGNSNVVEQGIPTLDFITQTMLNDKFGISLKARNLLNPDFNLVREANGDTGIPETVLSTYKLGLNLSLGFSYKF